MIYISRIVNYAHFVHSPAGRYPMIHITWKLFAIDKETAKYHVRIWDTIEESHLGRTKVTSVILTFALCFVCCPDVS